MAKRKKYGSKEEIFGPITGYREDETEEERKARRAKLDEEMKARVAGMSQNDVANMMRDILGK